MVVKLRTDRLSEALDAYEELSDTLNVDVTVIASVFDTVSVSNTDVSDAVNRKELLPRDNNAVVVGYADNVQRECELLDV